MKKNEKTIELCGGIPIPNNITELVFIIDKSGSMSGLESDTVGGFNSMIEQQKKLDGEVLVSTVLFNHHSDVVHDRVSIKNIEPMSRDEYCVGGSTALLDALGEAIRHISNIHKYARREDVPEKTIFLITTDGMENSSRKYSSDEVKRMIKEKEELGWEFIFVAANIDAVETAEAIGIRPERAASYCHDSEGTGMLYRAMGSAVTSFRKGRRVDDEWSKELKKQKDNG